MTKDEADAALAMAIRAHADAYEIARDDDMLNTYAVIAHWIKPIEDEKSYYTTHYSESSLPEHITEGLFRVGVRIAAVVFSESEEN